MSAMSHFALWSVGLRQTHSSTTESERRALYDFAKGRKRLVEIGVWQGLNTAKFRQVMSSDGILYAVDPFFPGRLGFSTIKVIAHSNVSKVNNGKVVWCEALGKDAAKRYQSSIGEPVDFIFVDGDHSFEGIRGDWMAWSPLIAMGGIVALHDSAVSPNTDVTEDTGSVVFTETIIKRDERFRLIRTVDSLTVLEKVAQP